MPDEVTVPLGTGEDAETSTSPPPSAEAPATEDQEVDVDAVWSRIRGTPKADMLFKRMRRERTYAGQIGSDLQKERDRIRAQLLAEMQDEQRRADEAHNLDNLSDADLGRQIRESKRLQQIIDQGKWQGETEAHRQWIETALGQLPADVRAEFEAKPWESPKELFEAVIGHKDMDLERRLSEFEQRQNDALRRLEDRMKGAAGLAHPSPNLAEGAPTSARASLNLRFIDDYEGAFLRGQITMEEMLEAQNNPALRYSYMPT